MSNYRPRGYSPPRHYSDQPRATTGNVYVTSFDTTSRGGSVPQSRGSVSSVSSGRSSVAYQAQPMRKSTLADGKTKTEYAIRPKHDSLNSVDVKPHLSVSTRRPSPPRYNPVLVASPREVNSPTVREDASRYLQPASSHGRNQNLHQRHNSTSISDLDSHNAANNARDKQYRPRQAPYVQKVYHDSRLPLREEDQWSYTGPREQFDRDYPQQAPILRDSGARRERPVSRYETHRPVTNREVAPPPPVIDRQLVRLDRKQPDRYNSRSGFDSDPDRGSEVSKRRHSIRQPVLHQQLMRDDGYSSARDDYGSRLPPKHRSSRYDDDVKPSESKPRDRPRDAPREHHRNDRDINETPDRNLGRERRSHRDDHRDRYRHHERDYEPEDRTQDERRKPRSRDHSPEHSGLKGLATGALGSLAAVGAVKGLSREHRVKDLDPEDDEQRSGRQRKHRHRSRKEDKLDEDEKEVDQRKDNRVRARGPDSSSSENPEDEVPRRRRSRRRRTEDEAIRDEKPGSANEQPSRRNSRVRTRDRDQSPSNADRTSRELVPVRRQSLDSESFDGRRRSPGEDEDDRPRRLQLVEPIQEKEDVKPKGILKPARQVPFPEDPNPIREGVAPLKDATKNGVPPNARWTKISRVLVNPEALEKAHERFEERDDYVIVLRVVTREEVKILAEKTKEIRAIREREWQERLEQEKRLQIDHGDEETHSDGEINYDRDNDNTQAPLAIEAGPPAPPANLHNLQNGTNQQLPPNAATVNAPPPEINVEANYSQNV